MLAVLASLVGGLPGSIASPVRAEVGLSDLPPGARPAELSVYLEAAVAGTQFYVCGMTDAFAWAWILRASSAVLRDGQQRPIGTYVTRITTIPPPPSLGSTWQDFEGGKVVAVVGALGQVPGDARAWERYDVRSREGSGAFSEARSIVRISAAWAIRPSESCDRSLAGTEVHLPYTGTDLFMK